MSFPGKWEQDKHAAVLGTPCVCIYLLFITCVCACLLTTWPPRKWQIHFKCIFSILWRSFYIIPPVPAKMFWNYKLIDFIYEMEAPPMMNWFLGLSWKYSQKNCVFKRPICYRKKKIVYFHLYSWDESAPFWCCWMLWKVYIVQKWGEKIVHWKRSNLR